MKNGVTPGGVNVPASRKEGGPPLCVSGFRCGKRRKRGVDISRGDHRLRIEGNRSFERKKVCERLRVGAVIGKRRRGERKPYFPLSRGGKAKGKPENRERCQRTT